MAKSPRSERGPHDTGEPVRLQAYLARSGVASRRASEELIAQGRVSVNGHTVTTPGTKVRPGVDRVMVDGERVAPEETVWVALHKPKGYVTTRLDTYGRRTIYDLLPDKYQSLFHVGRLDRDSEGLLLLTNDGDTANRLLHPSFGTTKEYLVDVEGKMTNEEMERLLSGVQLEEGLAKAEEVTRLHPVDVDIFRVRIVLREGKKREIRRMMDAIDHPVRRLSRRRFGPVELGELPSGKWRVLAPQELSAISREGKAKPKKPRGRAED
jgi:23S rRNA pseudouridine2605 synthase